MEIPDQRYPAMPTIVLINLAEVNPGATKQVETVLQGKADKKAQAKQKLLDNKRSFWDRVWGKRLTVAKTNVVRYDLISNEENQQNKFYATKAGERYGLSPEYIAEIQKQCDTAEKIYLCAHGSSRDRDQMFVEMAEFGKPSHREVLCSTATLVNFLTLILKSGTPDAYDIALIICFAGRSGHYDQTHNKDFLSQPEILKESLAYKIFAGLVKGKDGKGVNVRMTARLGEVRADINELHIATQTEEGVLAGLPLEGIGKELKLQDEAVKDLKEGYKLDLLRGAQLPKNEAEQKWVKAMKDYQAAQRAKSPQQAKYGKLVYEMDGGNLVITLKYPKPSVVLYRGGML